MICETHLVSELWKRARNIQTVLMDVDGVLTNGQIIYDTESREIKSYNAHDGLGITLARMAGMKTGILSARESAAIRYRAEELKIDYLYLGQFYKLHAYEKFKRQMQIKDEQICYIGDDLPDIPVLQKAGLPVAVQNAPQHVKEVARFQTRREGGCGAIREVIEFILYAQGRLELVMNKMLTLRRSVEDERSVGY